MLEKIKTELLGFIMAGVILFAYYNIPFFHDVFSKFFLKSAPACDNVAVKQSVVDISSEAMKNQMAHVFFVVTFAPWLGKVTASDRLVSELKDKNFVDNFDKDEQCKKIIEGLRSMVIDGQSISYEQLGEVAQCDKRKLLNSDKSKLLNNLISTYVDKPSAGISVINIRTTAKHNELEKSECKADIAFSNGNKVPIDYTAQLTSDGKLYVSVSGLK